MSRARAASSLPVTHRDGRRLWVAASFNEVQDPDTGRRVVVGSMRDITAEHYAGQREAALAAMGLLLSQADSVPAGAAGRPQRAAAALARPAGDRRHLDRRRGAVADRPPAPPSAGRTCPGSSASAIGGLRQRPLLTPTGRDVTGRRASASSTRRASWPSGSTLDPARPFTAEDRTLFALLCGYLGQALHRAHQTDQQRETALALQRAILGPSRLPPGFAARYEPASRPLEVGGDWYDLVELPDGRIGIVVGDCVGHGLEAATVMGQLRSACRALLLQDASPAQTLSAMDRFAALVPGAFCSTVFCGILDREAGRLTYSSAGHPPGILAHPDGRVELLEGGRSFPLAVAARGPADRGDLLPARPVGAAALHRRPGGTPPRLVRRGDRPGRRRSPAGPGRGVEDLASRVMSGLAPPGGYEDDVALVLFRHPAPLDLTFPADRGSSRRSGRRCGAGWAGAA